MDNVSYVGRSGIVVSCPFVPFFFSKHAFLDSLLRLLKGSVAEARV
jgi:hypothetical protein